MWYHFSFSDIDECATGEHTCDLNADCSNINGSFTCSCISGYSGDGMTCSGQIIFSNYVSCYFSIIMCVNCCTYLFIYIDTLLLWDACYDYSQILMNVLLVIIHTCDMNADCSNIDGSFTCSCITGYSGDGMTCSGWFLTLCVHITAIIVTCIATCLCHDSKRDIQR